MFILINSSRTVKKYPYIIALKELIKRGLSLVREHFVMSLPYGNKLAALIQLFLEVSECGSTVVLSTILY